MFISPLPDSINISRISTVKIWRFTNLSWLTLGPNKLAGVGRRPAAQGSSTIGSHTVVICVALSPYATVFPTAQGDPE